MADALRLPSVAERLVLGAQAVSPNVRVVGGTGLALLLGHRRSEDIDLFCGVREDIEPVVRALQFAAAAEHLTAERVRVPRRPRTPEEKGTSSVGGSTCFAHEHDQGVVGEKDEQGVREREEANHIGPRVSAIVSNV